METTFVLKASELTSDFAEGISKLFSKNAVLHIRVEYGSPSQEAASVAGGTTKQEVAAAVAEVPAKVAGKRGRKPGVKAAATSDAAPKVPGKRGRKPGIKAADAADAPVKVPGKRGRKPGVKNVKTESTEKRKPGPKPKVQPEAE